MHDGTKAALFALASILLVAFASILYFQDSEHTSSLTDYSTSAVYTVPDGVSSSASASQEAGFESVTGDVVRQNTKGVGGVCTTKNDCNPGLTCTNGKCAGFVAQAQGIDESKGFQDTDLQDSGLGKGAFGSGLEKGSRKGVKHSVSEVGGLLDMLKSIFSRLSSIEARLTALESKPALGSSSTAGSSTVGSAASSGNPPPRIPFTFDAVFQGGNGNLEIRDATEPVEACWFADNYDNKKYLYRIALKSLEFYSLCGDSCRTVHAGSPYSYQAANSITIDNICGYYKVTSGFCPATYSTSVACVPSSNVKNAYVDIAKFN
ncbi:hypothetical protein HZB00_02295 [Candidatus Woesearchaeota archaeon]|nr:hypothetical protein [Candidatus Woesearchaeota archaeon]